MVGIPGLMANCSVVYRHHPGTQSQTTPVAHRELQNAPRCQRSTVCRHPTAHTSTLSRWSSPVGNSINPPGRRNKKPDLRVGSPPGKWEKTISASDFLAASLPVSNMGFLLSRCATMFAVPCSLRRAYSALAPSQCSPPRQILACKTLPARRFSPTTSSTTTTVHHRPSHSTTFSIRCSA